MDAWNWMGCVGADHFKALTADVAQHVQCKQYLILFFPHLSAPHIMPLLHKAYDVLNREMKVEEVFVVKNI